MRAGAWELARRLCEGPTPDALLVSDYIDLPSLYGFLPPAWAGIPALLYFHENQLTYPGQKGEEQPDFHLGFTNILSCLRAERVVFNSCWHRDGFRDAALELLAQLPKPNPRAQLLERLEDAAVVSPGVDTDAIALGPGGEGALRIAYNHRWEHDKDPRAFLLACAEAVRSGSSLELVLLGERYADSPAGLESLLAELAPQIVHEGFAADHASYATLLGSCDVVASTARHEFFGMAVAEGLAAGCTPLVPDRLSYPEVLGEEFSAHLYSEGQLAGRIAQLAQDPLALRAVGHRARMRARGEHWGADITRDRLDDLVHALQSRE